MQVVTRGEDLWAPDDSPAQTHNSYVEKYYGDDDRLSTFIAEQDNVLTMPVFELVWDLHEEIIAFQAGGKNFEDLCIRRPDARCTMLGALEFWQANRTLYQQAVSSDEDLQLAVSALTYPDGSPVNRDIIFGKMKLDGSQNLVGAEGLLIGYFLIGGDDDHVSNQMRWESKFLDVLSGNTHSIAKVFRYSARSLDDELAKAIGGDIFLVVITYVAMTVYCCFALGKMTKVGSRVGLALAGIVEIVLALVAAYGFSSGIGTPFISIHQVLPYIMVSGVFC